MEFSKHNWATISETICPEMLIFGKWASWTLFFQNILTNPIISEILFLWRHHFSTLWRWDQKHWPVRPRNVFSNTNIGTEVHVPTRYWPRCNPKGPRCSNFGIFASDNDVAWPQRVQKTQETTKISRTVTFEHLLTKFFFCWVAVAGQDKREWAKLDHSLLAKNNILGRGSVVKK